MSEDSESNNVIQLREVQLPHADAANPDGASSVDEETIEALEFLLNEMKEGKYTSVAFVAIAPNGDAMTAWSADTRIQMAGAISVLYHRYMSELIGS
jgi:hypothetical protein